MANPKSRVISLISQAIAGGPLPGDAEKAIAAARTALLKTIYKRFDGHKQGSAEYERMASTAEAFIEHFQPFEPKPSLLAFQNDPVWSSKLQALEKCKELVPLPSTDNDNLLRALKFEASHQSVALEGNKLTHVQARIVWDRLEDSTTSNEQIPDVFPSAAELFPEQPTLAPDVIEFRNQVYAQRYFFEQVHPRGFAALSVDDMKISHRYLLRDTPMDGVALFGTHVQRAGQYRTVPMRAAGYANIYAYPKEVPRLMDLLMAWKNEQLQSKQLHRLLLACQVLTNFLHIHPFYDGNGRSARLIFGAALADAGYLPLVFQTIDLKGYADAMFAAEMHGDYYPLCSMVLEPMHLAYESVYGGHIL